MILISSEANWVSKLADGFIECDPLDEVACVAKVEELVKTTKIDGVITFWENAVPLAATLAQRFGWIGNTPQAALNARTRCMEFDQVSAAMDAALEDVQREHPGKKVEEAFTRGYQRGREHYQQRCDEASKAA